MSESHHTQAENVETRTNLANPLAFLAAPFWFIGSLTFGIVLLIVLLVPLAWGTFVWSEYGEDVARFVLYDAHWFAWLIALLALNLVVSLLCCFPRSRHKIAFVTAHVGILILLFGCYLTFKFGEEAQITLPEGAISCVAAKPKKQQFELTTIPHALARDSQPLSIPFRPGPFSWQDYPWDNWTKDKRGNWLTKTFIWYAMHFGKRDIGELSSGDPGIKIEALDYYAHSALEPVPPFGVSVLWKRIIQTVSEPGEVKEVPRSWESLRLELRQSAPGLRNVSGSSATMSQGGGERVSYTLATSPAELTVFQHSRPKGGNKGSSQTESGQTGQGQTGLWGEIILYYSGTHYSVNVEQLLELTGDQRFTVEGSGLQIGNVVFRDRGPIINFSVFTQSGQRESMTLFPDNPEMNLQARVMGVFGSYWVDPVRIMQQSVPHADHPMLKRLALPRLDFMQGTDKKLYYRLWSGREIIADGVVPDREGQKKPQFTLAEQTPYEVEVAIDRFMPQDVPGNRIVLVPTGRQNEQRVKLRVVFDGNEDTFWLRAVVPTVVPLPPEQDQIRYVYGKNRTLCVQLNFENIDLGFGILLKKFEKRTEPGTRMPSHFSSLVDYVEPIDPKNTGVEFSRDFKNYRTLPGGEDVLISMNRPGYFSGKGRGYRIYQSSYIGPFYPDQPQFHELYDRTIFPWETRPRESLAMSTLSVNTDPGRGWKYFGSFLIVLGIALFVWRRR